MIDFNCGGCGRAFHVRDEFAGKKASCKRCGTVVCVPFPPDASEHAGAGPLPLRIRRLTAEARQLQLAFGTHTVGSIRILEAIGEPPEQYRIEYALRSLADVPRGQVIHRDVHQVEINLPVDYPRLPPHCKMLTPVFHPNIDSNTICIGDHWTAGQRLVDLVIRIGEMLAYQAYNIKSPLNGEAAMWADLNRHILPIDSRPLYAADAV